MIEEKHFRPYHVDIRELSIYVNDYCSKRCKHCYFIRDGKGHSDVDPRWVEWCCDNFKIQRSIIVGGEPILSPKLLEIFEILKSKNVAITISTNCDWVNWGRKEEKVKKGKKKKETIIHPMGPRDMKWNDAVSLFKMTDNVQISIEGDEKTTD